LKISYSRDDNFSAGFSFILNDKPNQFCRIKISFFNHGSYGIFNLFFTALFIQIAFSTFRIYCMATSLSYPEKTRIFIFSVCFKLRNHLFILSPGISISKIRRPY
jgi:hypothetical protein